VKSKLSSALSLFALIALSGAAYADTINTATAQATAPEGSAAPAATLAATKGHMLISSNGSRLGSIYKVGPDGSAQIIIDGKLVTVPAATISLADGKLTTSLTKSQVLALH
jgi:hypothetical protein